MPVLTVKSMKGVLVAGSLAMGVASAGAVNTDGYVALKEIKAFPTYVAIYLSDDQRHQCSDTSFTTLFRLDPSARHLVAAVYMAFAGSKSVSLSYACGSDTFPHIDGVRVR